MLLSVTDSGLATLSTSRTNSQNTSRRGRLVNVRDIAGQIVSTGSFISTTVTVASFGDQLDHFLDCWGFDRNVFTRLENVWNNTDTDQEFVDQMMAYGMGSGEAQWFWEEIDEAGGIQGQRSHHILRRMANRR